MNFRTWLGPATTRERPSFALTAERHFSLLGVGLRRGEEYGSLKLNLGVLHLYFTHPRWAWRYQPGDFDDRDYGFSIHGGFLFWNWGRDNRVHALRLNPFDWYNENTQNIDHGPHGYTYQWRYCPQTIQHVTATVQERHTRQRLHFQGRPTRFTRPGGRYFWVEFSEEMGDERSSWKGGTIGTSFLLRPDESFHDAYRRMQKELIFCRGN